MVKLTKDLKADECSFSNNFSNGGGAIMNYGHAEISSTPFKGNSSTFGGAIFNMAKNLVHYSNNHSSNLIEDGYLKVVIIALTSGFGHNRQTQK